MGIFSNSITLFKRIIRKLLSFQRPIFNVFIYTYYQLFKKRTISFNGKTVSYFYSLHNETFKNERAIEIPIAMQYVKQYQNKKILEIGNVLQHYYKFNHTIVDKYEKGKTVLNYDITDYRSDEKYDLILTISTLEHIGWDEYSRYGKDVDKKSSDPHLLLKAINNLKQMLSAKGIILATMPLGFNSRLDALIEKKESGFSNVYCFKRVSMDNEWSQVSYSEIKGIRYASPFPCANGLIICEYRSE